MAPAATTWTDALEKKFLLELLVRGGSSAANLAALAEKWGPPHSEGSLRMKLTRMKALYAKENDLEGAAVDATPKKGAGVKRKTMVHEPAGEEEDDEVEVKPKKARTPKVKKVKAEIDSEEGTGI